MIVTANEYKSSVSRPCGVCRRELSSQKGAVSTGMSSVDFASRKNVLKVAIRNERANFIRKKLRDLGRSSLNVLILHH